MEVFPPILRNRSRNIGYQKCEWLGRTKFSVVQCRCMLPTIMYMEPLKGFHYMIKFDRQPHRRRALSREMEFEESMESIQRMMIPGSEEDRFWVLLFRYWECGNSSLIFCLTVDGYVNFWGNFSYLMCNFVFLRVDVKLLLLIHPSGPGGFLYSISALFVFFLKFFTETWPRKNKNSHNSSICTRTEPFLVNIFSLGVPVLKIFVPLWLFAQGVSSATE